ncbi:unnamed protein product [Gongylonema pulchrum]|uniref:RRM domain-containing protein n=1 Tax=Gongylonema pulchrum TaxID=637853 RepID=A0A183F089_9BILA|nr:unnamed protein product [Gongylonema pulchrum]VDN45829.1 unnamed protein product [Gongylonema pulchrum]
MLQAFAKYGVCRVEWPMKDSRNGHADPGRPKGTGYVYMVLECDGAVKSLLQDCTRESGTAGEWYFTVGDARRVSDNL